MNLSIFRTGLAGLLAAAAAFWLLPGAVAGGPPNGYADYDALRLELEAIGQSRFAALESLGTTLGGRDVYLLEIGTGSRDQKPAILLVGSVEPAHLVGGDLCVRLARRLTDEAARSKQVRKMLDRVTFYVIPRPAPDACEALFHRPYAERSVNERPIDDDGDGRVDEDPPEDLNGDGLITMLRVQDAAGPYIPHPDDDRVMVKADAKKNEIGRFAIYVEGRDHDHDEQIGEDPAGGVAFNRNFPFRYPYFERGAGPHQVSEVESRAVADFAFDHPNIAVVLTATPEDNLMHPWKPGDSDKKKIKTLVAAADAPYFHHVAEAYQEIHGGKNAPESPQGEGSFSQWAYYHYGRWSFAFRAWWIPKIQPDKDDPVDEDDTDEKAAADKPKHSDDLNALRWFAEEKIDGFVPWERIEHPDFPGRKVEVGGFKPLVRLNPSHGELAPLADKHWQFLCRTVELLPRLAIREARVEPLGGGVWRVTAVVVNDGFLPTACEMGRKSRVPLPLQIQIELPDGVRLVSGHPRRQFDPLPGGGGRSESAWLVAAPPGEAVSVRLKAWSPSVGTATRRVKLEPQEQEE